MSCSVLSVVASVAAAGLAGGGGLIPGLDGFDLGGLTDGFGDILGGIDLGGFDIGSLGELGINTDLLDNLADFDIGSMGDVLDGLGDQLGDLATEAFDICGDFVGDALMDLPDGLSGLIDTDIFSDFALEGLDFASPNLFDSLSSQASSFLQNGTAGFTEIISAAKGFAEQSASALASIQNAANFQIGGVSFNAMTIFDQVTGGAVTRTLQPITAITGAVGSAAAVGQNLLGSVQSTINAAQSSFSALTKDISEWGTMYDVTNLEKTFEANEFAQHLVDQNIPDFNNWLYQEGQINPALIKEMSPGSVINLLESVPKEITQAVTKAVGFTKNITNLADALVPAAVLSTAALSIVGSFKDVTNKLTALGPTNVPSIGELGRQLNKIEFPTSSVLLGIERSSTSMNTLLNKNVEQRQQLTGSGSGVFGNPTMNDILGSFTGTYYTPRLIGTLSAQKRLLDSAEGQTLKSAIQTAVNNAKNNLNTDQADAAAIRTASAALFAKTDSQTQEDLALLKRFQDEMVNQLAVEKRNLKAARIDTGNVVGSISSIMGFVSSLQVAYDDNFKIGYENFVKGAAAQDEYGDAIRYTIVEGKNRSILDSMGVSSSTISVFDYTEQYAKEQAAILAKCCPPTSMSLEFMPRGTLLSTYCENGNYYGIYADGNGLSYFQLIQSNSPQCI